MTGTLSTIHVNNNVYVQAKRAHKRFFVKCAFLVLYDSLFHTADDDAIIQIIGATSYLCATGLLLEALHAML